MSRTLFAGAVLCIAVGLSACGGDEANSAQLSGAGAAASTPGVTPSPTPTSTDTSSPVKESGSFASFDFQSGTVYPAMANIRIEDVEVPPGASEAFVPVVLDRATPNTVVARVRTRNGEGGDYAIQGTNFGKVDTFVIFRHGDPLRQTVRIPLTSMSTGKHFDLYFPTTVTGAKVADGSATITAVSGAPAPAPATGSFRAPRTFRPTGTLRYTLDPSNMRWSDKGSLDSWSTALAHGRTQTANKETGLYIDPGIWPQAEAPFRIENGELVLHSQELKSLIMYDGTYWEYGAAALTGLRMPETHVRYGQYEWVARMPNRKGAWPALWLLGVNGWPPEIDVYEGFGYSGDWNFATDISANIHGGPRNNGTFDRPLRLNAAAAYKLSGFDTAYHSYAVDVQKDYITWFVDGIEVYQAVNPFHEEDWYPIMNVAVKTTAPYTEGSGDMRVRSFRVWDSGR